MSYYGSTDWSHNDDLVLRMRDIRKGNLDLSWMKAGTERIAVNADRRRGHNRQRRRSGRRRRVRHRQGLERRRFARRCAWPDVRARSSSSRELAEIAVS